jgi:hypothetical protein
MEERTIAAECHCFDSWNAMLPQPYFISESCSATTIDQPPHIARCLFSSVRWHLARTVREASSVTLSTEVRTVLYGSNYQSLKSDRNFDGASAILVDISPKKCTPTVLTLARH